MVEPFRTQLKVTWYMPSLVEVQEKRERVPKGRTQFTDKRKWKVSLMKHMTILLSLNVISI